MALQQTSFYMKIPSPIVVASVRLPTAQLIDAFRNDHLSKLETTEWGDLLNVSLES
jgi:hypothetical protein